MNTLQIQNQTMSSHEMAELTGSRHDNVMRCIKSLLSKNVIKSTTTQIEEVKNHLNQSVEVAKMEKRDSLIVAARLSPEFTARIIDRWQELEASQAPQIPQTFSEALRLAADLAEEKQRLEQKIEADKPKVEFVDSYVEVNDSKCLRDVAKLLGWPPQKFNAQLNADKIIFKQSGNWMPYSHIIDKGYFQIKTGNQNDNTWMQTRVTPRGVEYLAKRYGKSVN